MSLKTLIINNKYIYDILKEICVNFNFQVINGLDENIYGYEGFKWKPVVDPNSNIYYGTYKECALEIQKMYLKNRDLIKKIKKYGNKFINKHNNRVPPFNKLNEYYY